MQPMYLFTLSLYKGSNQEQSPYFYLICHTFLCLPDTNKIANIYIHISKIYIYICIYLFTYILKYN